MDVRDINSIVSGALVYGYIVAALFFMRFWLKTHDRLFAFFASAFTLLAGQRLVLALTTEVSEDATLLYVIRLVAFLLILYAIIDKNRPRAGARS